MRWSWVGPNRQLAREDSSDGSKVSWQLIFWLLCRGEVIADIKFIIHDLGSHVREIAEEGNFSRLRVLASFPVFPLVYCVIKYASKEAVSIHVFSEFENNGKRFDNVPNIS